MAISHRGVLGLTIGWVTGGHTEFVFFPEVDSNNVVADLRMPRGTPVSRTREVVRKLEDGIGEVRRRLKERASGGGSVLRHVNTTIGQQPFAQIISGEAMQGAVSQGGASHLAEVNIELQGADQRTISSTAVARMWRDAVGRIAGVSSLTFTSSFFSTGRSVNVELSHDDFPTLVKAAERLKGKLADFDGVQEVKDSYQPGKQELKLRLTPAGRTLGLTAEALATQVRHAFYGAEVQRLQRGRREVKVMVRYPDGGRRSVEALKDMRLRVSGGERVPLATVAEVRRGRGPAEIERTDRQRVISVTADVDEAVANANAINNRLASTVLPAMSQEFPGLSYRFQGERREQKKSLRSLAVNFVVALLGIFALLGIQFRSYSQPLIVMAAIPFGLIGAVVGHALMGYELSILSSFGVVALTGVVVNDSLILIDLINRQRASSEGKMVAVVVDSGQRRFRPIFLTTLTTFVGLTPMLLERSLQARFLVPMAISIAFGILFATAITLLLVPALYMVLEDTRAALGKGASPEETGLG